MTLTRSLEVVGANMAPDVEDPSDPNLEAKPRVFQGCPIVDIFGLAALLCFYIHR